MCDAHQVLGATRQGWCAEKEGAGTHVRPAGVEEATRHPKGEEGERGGRGQPGQDLRTHPRAGRGRAGPGDWGMERRGRVTGGSPRGDEWVNSRARPEGPLGLQPGGHDALGTQCRLGDRARASLPGMVTALLLFWEGLSPVPTYARQAPATEPRQPHLLQNLVTESGKACLTSPLSPT